MPRLAVARLWFCSNSFTPRRTPLPDFLACEWTANGEPEAPPVAGSDMDGLARFLATRPGWEPTFLRGASAPPGGPLIADVFNRWMMDVETALLRGRFDAVYLSLHGACQAEGDPNADLTILRRVRAAVGRTPVVASFDMHANVSPETALLLDGASANRVWPHGGADAAAARALDLLEGILARGTRPIGAFARAPSVLASLQVRAALSGLWARDIPALRAPVLDASVFGGFAWGDTPHAGPSALVWADRDMPAARDAAQWLAARLAAAMPSAPRLPRPEHAIAGALLAGTGPFVLLDVADDPMAGGVSDTTGLLRALLDSGVTHAAFGVLHDPDTVAAAQAAGEGGRIDRTLGGRLAPFFGAPVGGEMDVVRLSDGPVPPGGAHADARPDGMALLRLRGVEILVSSARPGVLDPDSFARAGIDLDRLRVLGVKGGALARDALASRFATIVACDGVGPTCPDLLTLPFRDVPKSRRMPLAEPVKLPALRPLANWMPLDEIGAGEAEGRHEQRGPQPQEQRAHAMRA